MYALGSPGKERGLCCAPCLCTDDGTTVLWLSFANIRSRDCCRREIVLVMQSAKDRFGVDGVRVLAAMTRTGLSEVGNHWWWIRSPGAQRHVGTP